MKNILATGNLYGETITIKQVSKIVAQKAFKQGKTVYLQSSNMWPFGVWQSVMPIEFNEEKKEDLNSKIELFEKWGEYAGSKEKPTIASYFEGILNEYSYYNCDSERGKYVHFYIKQS